MNKSIATLLAGLALAAPARADDGVDPACATLPRTMAIVAHEDDDLLFLSPDLLHDVRAGHCVRTVYVTAGDANRDMDYVRSRELGIQAAYAQMARQPDAWDPATLAIGGQALSTWRLRADPRLSLVFMHLPDGDRDGGGFERNGFRSLQKLMHHDVDTIATVDGASHYTLASLDTVLAALVEGYAPDTIRAQDPRPQVLDHSDHKAVAMLIQRIDYRRPHTLVRYVDDVTLAYLPNLGTQDGIDKTAVFATYAAHDPELHCIACWYSPYAYWVQRQYVVRP